MSSKGNDFSFMPKFSRRYLSLSALLHLGALCCVAAVLPLGYGWGLIVLALVLGFSLLGIYRQQLHVCQQLFRRSPDGRWWCRRGQHWQGLSLQRPVLVLSWLVILRFNGQGGPLVLVLDTACLPEASFHRLRLCLLHQLEQR